MKVLIIKTSSMGDVLHTLPALTDAARVIPNITFDWVVEENFVEIPRWHSHVNRVIPVALRRWRKNIFRNFFSKEYRTFKKSLRNERYDVVIDAQGLLKSAWLTRLARGEKHGLDKYSAREGLAGFFYQKKHKVERRQHAVKRVRELFAKALGYSVPHAEADYGIDHSKLSPLSFSLPHRYIVCLHGTTWATKHYPENYWIELIKKITAEKISVALPWGNEIEKARATRFAENNPLAIVLPKCNLSQMATVLDKATAIVAVDTGLSHLSAALHKLTIGLYGPTNPALTGTEGPNQIHLAAHFPCAPCLQRVCTYTNLSIEKPACFDTVNPDRIMQHLEPILKEFQ